MDSLRWAGVVLATALLLIFMNHIRASQRPSADFDRAPGAHFVVGPFRGQDQKIRDPSMFGLNPDPDLPQQYGPTNWPHVLYEARWYRREADALLLACNVRRSGCSAIITTVQNRFVPDVCAAYTDAEQRRLWPTPRIWAEEAKCHHPSPCADVANATGPWGVWKQHVCDAYRQGLNFSG